MSQYKGPAGAFDAEGNHTGPGEWLTVIRTINGIKPGTFGAPECFYDNHATRILAQDLLDQRQAANGGTAVEWPPSRTEWPRYIEVYPDFEVVMLKAEDAVIIVPKSDEADDLLTQALADIGA